MSKILVIQPESSMDEEIPAILEGADYEVFTAYSGEAGLQLADQLKPDLILTELDTPTVSGEDLIDLFHKETLFEQMPILFLSGMANWDQMRRGKLLGIDSFILKPISHDELLTHVAAQLKRQTAVQQLQGQGTWSRNDRLTQELPADIQAALLMIATYGDLMEARRGELRPSEIAEYASGLQETSSQLRREIANTLLLSQLKQLKEKGGNSPQLDSSASCLKPARIINAAAYAAAAKWRREDDLILSTINMPIMIHDQEFFRIASELIDNGFKFSPHGSRVQVKSEVSRSHFALTVTHQGEGMSRAQMAAVKETAAHGDPTHSAPKEAKGLSIAMRLAELYGGYIAFAHHAGGFATTVILSLRYPS